MNTVLLMRRPDPSYDKQKQLTGPVSRRIGHQCAKCTVCCSRFEGLDPTRAAGTSTSCTTGVSAEACPLATLMAFKAGMNCHLQGLAHAVVCELLLTTPGPVYTGTCDLCVEVTKTTGLTFVLAGAVAAVLVVGARAAGAVALQSAGGAAVVDFSVAAAVGQAGLPGGATSAVASTASPFVACEHAAHRNAARELGRRPCCIAVKLYCQHRCKTGIRCLPTLRRCGAFICVSSGRTWIGIAQHL